MFIKLILCCVSVKELRHLWTCPEYKEPKHFDMVQCDSCDVWFHWYLNLFIGIYKWLILKTLQSLYSLLFIFMLKLKQFEMHPSVEVSSIFYSRLTVHLRFVRNLLSKLKNEKWIKNLQCKLGNWFQYDLSFYCEVFPGGLK